MGINKYKLEINTLFSEYLNLKINTTKFIEPEKVEFSTKNLIPNKKYRTNLMSLFDKYIKSNLNNSFDKKTWETIHNVIIRPLYLKNRKEFSFLIRISKYMFENYDSISHEYKLEMYKNISYLEKFTSSKYLQTLIKKFNGDSKLNIFKNLFDWKFDSLDYKQSESNRKRWIKDFINNLKLKDIDLILELDEYYKKYKNSGIIHVSAYNDLMIELGTRKPLLSFEIIKEMEKEHICPYLFASTFSSLSEKKRNELVSKLTNELRSEVANLLWYYPNLSSELVEIIIKADNNVEVKKGLARYLLRYKINDAEKKKEALKIIKGLNESRECINLEYLDVTGHQLKNIFSIDEIKIILENMNIKDKYNCCSIIKPLFEAYPTECRNFLELRIKKNNGFRNEDFYFLEKSSNIKDELKNNLKWAIELLNKNIDNPNQLLGVIDHMILKQDNESLTIIKNEILSQDNAIKVIKLLEVISSLYNCQDILKEIIKVNNSEEIERAMFQIIHNSGSVTTGKFGLVKTSELKRDIFKIWKNDANTNVKKFGIKYFKLFENEVSIHLLDANERENLRVEEFNFLNKKQ